MAQRTDLERRLWLRAKELRERTPADGRAVAYAVLLSAQETFFGIAPLNGLYTDPEFEQLTGLDARQAIQLRRHIEDHIALGATFHHHYRLAQKAIAALRTTTTTTASTAPTTATAGPTTAQRDPADAERRVIEPIDAMIALAEVRPDLQWLTATTAAQLFAQRNSPSGLPAAAWAQTWGVRLPNDGHFSRWMSEAAADPSRAKGPRRSLPVFKKVH